MQLENQIAQYNAFESSMMQARLSFGLLPPIPGPHLHTLERSRGVAGRLRLRPRVERRRYPPCRVVNQALNRASKHWITSVLAASHWFQPSRL
jgi:hypothetical protein